jgi:hypothetical protein
MRRCSADAHIAAASVLTRFLRVVAAKSRCVRTKSCGVPMSRAMCRKIVGVLVGEVLLVAAAQAAPLPNVGATVTMDSDYFGCQSLNDLAHVVTLDWVQNNKIASIEYGTQHCIVLHKNEQYNVQDSSAVRGAVCLRQGRNQCYWTNAQMIKAQ